MPIPGITVIQDNGYVVCYIDVFTDEIKSLIREELSYICYGRNHVQEDELEEYPHYSYEKTLEEFLVRFNRQKRSVRKGMAGEFLAHLLIKYFVEGLEPISIYFNKEERSIKKGFDLNFRDTNEKAIWYGEVKSGEVNNGADCNISNVRLLNKSKRSIQGLLSGERLNIWDSVLIDTELMFAAGEKIEVQRLLKGDVRDIKASTDNIQKNAVLVSVLFHDINTRINSGNFPEHLRSIIEEGIFSKVILFSIQKNTFEQLHEFLTADLATLGGEQNEHG